MSKQNFKSQAKRKRELAKLDKRQAKDQKRALKRAEEGGPVVAVAVTPAAPVAARGAAPVAAPKPFSLAEAVERWKTTKVVKARVR
jgi:hypothetical protein